MTISNRLGLHARPAAEFVKCAASYAAEITISKDGVEVNGKSILGVMTLAAECGSTVTIRAHGLDAGDAVDTLVTLLSKEYEGEV
ncbi:MAG: HPr family phosphocarrier protein [Gemmatimonadales bacterium]